MVVHERLLVPHRSAAAAADEAVLPRGLPVAVASGAAGARAVGVLAVHPAEEEPLPVPRLQRRPLCGAAPTSPDQEAAGGDATSDAIDWGMRGKRTRTREVGGVGLVDVDVGDIGGGAARDDPALEEVEDEFLVGGAEAESRRPPARRRGLHLAGWFGGVRVVCRVKPMLRLL